MTLKSKTLEKDLAATNFYFLAVSNFIAKPNAEEAENPIKE